MQSSRYGGADPKQKSDITSAQFRRVFEEMKIKLADLGQLQADGFRFDSVDQYVNRYEDEAEANKLSNLGNS